MKNQFENANLPEPTNLNDATTKRYVDAEYFDNIPIRDVNNDFIVSIFINKTLSSAAVFSIEVGKKYLWKEMAETFKMNIGTLRCEYACP